MAARQEETNEAETAKKPLMKEKELNCSITLMGRNLFMKGKVCDKFNIQQK